MSDTQPTAQLIPFGEVQRLVQERRRHARNAATGEGRDSFGSPRSTSQVRRLLTEYRTDPSGPDVA